MLLEKTPLKIKILLLKIKNLNLMIIVVIVIIVTLHHQKTVNHFVNPVQMMIILLLTQQSQLISKLKRTIKHHYLNRNQMKTILNLSY